MMPDPIVSGLQHGIYYGLTGISQDRIFWQVSLTKERTEFTIKMKTDHKNCDIIILHDMGIYIYVLKT